jgi:hypothetical protein
MDHILAIAFIGVGIVGVAIIGMLSTAIDCLRGINQNLGALVADNAQQLKQFDLIVRHLKAIENGAYMSDTEKQELKEFRDKFLRATHLQRAKPTRTGPSPARVLGGQTRSTTIAAPSARRVE